MKAKRVTATTSGVLAAKADGGRPVPVILRTDAGTVDVFIGGSQPESASTVGYRMVADRAFYADLYDRDEVWVRSASGTPEVQVIVGRDNV